MIIVKKIIKTTLLSFAIFSLIITGGYLFIDDTILIPRVSTYLESVTGMHITYNKDALLTRTMSPLLQVNNLLIEDKDKKFRVHLKSLNLQVSLTGLLFGKLEVPLLILGDAIITVKQSTSQRPISIPKTLPLTPVFRDIQFSKIEINQGGDNLSLPTTNISELLVSLDKETDSFIVRADASLATNTIHIKATLPRIHKAVKTRHLPFSIEAKNKTIELFTGGTINFLSSPPTIEANASLLTPDLETLPTGNNDFKIQGALTGRARITGTYDKLAAHGISLNWKGPGRSTASVSGNIDNLLQFSDCELKADGRLEKSPWLAPILPDNMGSLESTEFTSQITCPDTNLAFDNTNLQVKTVEELNMTLNGQFNLSHLNTGKSTPENIDLNLEFTAPTTRTARFLFFDNIWEFGAINGKANIRSTTGAPAIEDISVIARDKKGIEVSIIGRIDKFPLNPDISSTGYDMDVTMKAEETALMAERFDLILPLPGPLAIKYRIEGDSQALELNKIDLAAGKEKGLKIATSGSLHFGKWDQDDPLEDIDLNVQAASRNNQDLETFLGLQPPDFGPLKAQAVVHTISGKHRIDNFLVQSEEENALQISISGSAQQVAIFDKPGINGIELKATTSVADTAILNNVFRLPKAIPAFGSFKASGDISGNLDKISINNVLTNVGSEEGFSVELKGDLGKFKASNQWSPKETDLTVSAHFATSSSLTNLLGIKIPEIGPVTATAIIKEKKHQLMLKSSQLTVGESEKPTISASGHIYDMLAFKDIEMVAQLNLEGQLFAALSDNISLPELKPLTGTITISDNDGTLGVDDFNIKTTNDEFLTIETKGVFADFSTPDTLSISTHLTAKELPRIGALFDQQWPAMGPVQLDSQIHKKDDGLVFNTKFSAGDMVIKSDLKGLFDNPLPQISGAITAHNFSLPPPSKGKNETKENKLQTSLDNYIFSRDYLDLSLLKKIDLDLSIGLESFAKNWSKANSAHFAVSLQSGNLNVYPAKIIYPQGELNFNIDLKAQDIPEINLEAHAQGINPWLALHMKNPDVSKEFNAAMDVDIKVSSSGISEHELAANMQGGVYIKMKDGQIRRSLVDLLFLDFIGWTVSQVRPNKYIDVKCGVADYTITDGLIKTNALFLDTKSITIAGEGTIDLDGEEIDYVFLPRKKSSIIQKVSPVNVNGTLSDPSVKTLPWKTAATTYGSLFFAPYLFVGAWATDLFTKNVSIEADNNPCHKYQRTIPQ